jgi:ribonuclease P protein component
MRFRPEQHLRRQGEIRAVREQGRRVDCGAFTLWWKLRPALAPASCEARSVSLENNIAATSAAAPRVCVIASTAAVGGAVRRNRAKRRLREIFRREQTRVPAGCDLLLIARAAAGTQPLAELAGKFSDACRYVAAAGVPATR